MLLSNNIEAACQPAPTELVRQNMLVGAMMAGQAFANAPVGAIHALAYPLGGLFHLSHGLSNALVMVQVMEFNLPDCAQLYAELADHLRLSSDSDEGVQAQTLIIYLKALVLRLYIKPQLRDHGINETYLERLATDAMLQTRLLVNNPRDLTFDDALTIYRAAF